MKLFLLSFYLISASVNYSQNEFSLPDHSSQLIVVITDTINSTKGMLSYFKKNNAGYWFEIKTGIPVVLGKGGLGWGKGLHKLIPDNFPIKKEGDSKSPAGIFRLSAAFGFAAPGEMKELKIPYIHITEMLECVDDTISKYYNDIIYRDSVDKVDWLSSEKMHRYGKWYEQGIIIEHNKNPEVKGSGSCIFIHNWVSPDETSTGCTEMEPSELNKLLLWLDSAQNPVFVQIPKFLFDQYCNKWKLTLLPSMPGRIQ